MPRLHFHYFIQQVRIFLILLLSSGCLAAFNLSAKAEDFAPNPIENLPHSSTFATEPEFGPTNPPSYKESSAVPFQVSESSSTVGPDVSVADKEKMLAAYNRGVELFKIAQTQGNRGDKKAQERVLKESLAQFDAALKIKPDFVEAQSNIGFAYLTLKKYKQAVDAFEKALAIQPKHLNSLNGLATTYTLNNQVPLALQTFETLTTLSPAQPDYLFNMGAVFQKSGRYAEAEKAYFDALKAKPDHQRTLFNLGTLKENQNQYEAALGYYEKAKSAEVGNPIGLEAMKRITLIQQALSPTQSPPEPVSKK